MKLYIWNKDVLRDYSSGIAFAIAESEEQARELITEKTRLDPEDVGLDKPADEVHELDEPYAAYLYGSM